MRIQIENCNVIDSGSIDIEPHMKSYKSIGSFSLKDP